MTETIHKLYGDREISAFLVGGAFTIADIALYAYTHTAEDGGFELSPYPGVCNWLDRVTRQDGFVSMAEACK